MKTLRNGATDVHEGIVSTTMITLDRMLKENPIAFFEAAQLARDPSHVLFGRTGAQLAEAHLIESDGKMFGPVRDIILSAVEGDDFDLRLVSPYPE